MIGHGYSRADMIVVFIIKKISNGSFVYLLLFVDDMLIVPHNILLINDLKAQLSNEFKMKDLGIAKKILDMEIHREHQTH